MEIKKKKPKQQSNSMTNKNGFINLTILLFDQFLQQWNQLEMMLQIPFYFQTGSDSGHMAYCKDISDRTNTITKREKCYQGTYVAFSLLTNHFLLKLRLFVWDVNFRSRHSVHFHIYVLWTKVSLGKEANCMQVFNNKDHFLLVWRLYSKAELHY